ncbi:hypothetical protein ACOSQ4_005688 [Xanthoceras sorbifolium]
MEVQILSKKLIKPSVPTPCHLRNMSISFIDQLMAPKTVPFIFYYAAEDDGNNNHPVDHQHVDDDQRRKRLEKSLSEFLTLFYPLAGRYIKESHLIECNDEGVEYVEALVNGQLSQILRGEFETTKELNRFVPDHVEESATSPLVSIQINIFNCGGLAIGMRFTHRILDGFTISMITKGWAKACKIGNINDVIVPNFDSCVLFPPTDDMSRFNFQPLSKTKSSHEVVTRMFVFDASTISKLKAEAMSAAGAGGLIKRVPSTTEVMIALIWRAQINAAGARNNGRLRNSLLLVSMDLRGKTFKKIPENCCGNVFTLVTARFQADDGHDNKKNMGLSDFVVRVRDAIRNSINEFAKKPKEDDDHEEDGFLLSKVMRPRIEIIEETRKGDQGDVHMFSSLRNFPFYEVDFGWGKPAWVSMAQRPYKGVSFLDRKCGNGIEAWVSMEEEDMAFFQNDPDIGMSMDNVQLIINWDEH